MKIYLRTHPIDSAGGNKGWKYFGYTKHDDVNKRTAYNTDNSLWGKHIQQYGNNYTTEILLETKDQFEATLFCINYSLEHCIWNNPEYANLEMENGLPGRSKKKFWNKTSKIKHLKASKTGGLAAHNCPPEDRIKYASSLGVVDQKYNSFNNKDINERLLIKRKKQLTSLNRTTPKKKNNSKIIINGVVFDNIGKAIPELKLSYGQIYGRITKPAYSNYKWL